VSPLDVLASELGLGSDARAIAGQVAAFYAEIDAEREARAAGCALPCRTGCDECCRHSVFLSAPELLYAVVELVENHDLATVERVVAEMRGLFERFEDEIEALEAIESGAERDEVAARIHFACPMLDTGGACIVYRARELNARSFGQTWDHRRDEPYGCELTVGRLAILGAARGRTFLGAREARERFTARFVATEKVQIYPWWFARYGERILEAARALRGAAS
jgi:hypothetical protein